MSKRQLSEPSASSLGKKNVDQILKMNGSMNLSMRHYQIRRQSEASSWVIFLNIVKLTMMLLVKYAEKQMQEVISPQGKSGRLGS